MIPIEAGSMGTSFFNSEGPDSSAYNKSAAEPADADDMLPLIPLLVSEAWRSTARTVW